MIKFQYAKHNIHIAIFQFICVQIYLFFNAAHASSSVIKSYCI